MTDGTMGDRKEPLQRRMERRSSGNDLVSALCQPSRQYPSSAPSTPVAKAVRFDDSQLEEVRHFFQLDQPLAISTPEEETFDHPLALTHADGIFWMPHAEENLVIDLTNFPVDTPARRTRVVRLEHLTLSDERGFLQGTVSVANLSYHKHVACRFTFDDWQTIHEVKGHYTTPGRTKHPPEGYDSFFFSIDLRDLIGLSAKTLRCCVRCNTGGCEYWDNNDGANFDVRFASATKAAYFTTASDTFRTLPIRGDIAQGPDEVARTRAARFEKSPSPLNRKPDHSARRSPNRLEGLTIDIGRQPLSRSYDLERSLLEAKKAGEGARKKGTS